MFLFFLPVFFDLLFATQFHFQFSVNMSQSVTSWSIASDFAKLENRTGKQERQQLIVFRSLLLDNSVARPQFCNMNSFQTEDSASSLQRDCLNGLG